MAEVNWQKMGYVVAHFRKVKTSAGLGNVANHNSRANVLDETGGWKDREHLPPWMVHPDRIDQNEGHAGRRDDSIQRAWHRSVKDAALKRKPQKNAASAVEAVFSASPESLKDSDWKKYFEDCLGWVDKKFGHENILQWNTHYDEQTPHMHVLLIPIIRDPDLGNKYSSADFLGGREGLRKIQDEIFESVGKKYKLERGIDGSQARHTDQAGWVANLKKEKETELKNKEKKIEAVLKVSTAEAAAAIDHYKKLKTMTPFDFKNTADKIQKEGCINYGEYQEKMISKSQKKEIKKSSGIKR